MTTKLPGAVEDLYRVPENGKAEIVNGELVLMSPTGDYPARAGGRIYVSLDQYERRTRAGYAYPDNVGFRVNLPTRESFSPDAAFYTGQRTGMKFLNGAPIFAAEVRSENDYGEHAEQEMAEKRRDYFAAGTLVVWDVDLLGEAVVTVYRADDPTHPTIYRRGEMAAAEPALPGWTFAVDDLFA
jgi:Uma2 family endonuclease